MYARFFFVVTQIQNAIRYVLDHVYPSSWQHRELTLRAWDKEGRSQSPIFEFCMVYMYISIYYTVWRLLCYTRGWQNSISMGAYELFFILSTEYEVCADGVFSWGFFFTFDILMSDYSILSTIWKSENNENYVWMWIFDGCVFGYVRNLKLWVLMTICVNEMMTQRGKNFRGQIKWRKFYGIFASFWKNIY